MLGGERDMIYHFTATQVVEITGEVEADSREEAMAIIENIQANPNQKGEGIVFSNFEKIDYFDVNTDCEFVEVTDIYPDYED